MLDAARIEPSRPGWPAGIGLAVDMPYMTYRTYRSYRAVSLRARAQDLRYSWARGAARSGKHRQVGTRQWPLRALSVRTLEHSLWREIHSLRLLLGSSEPPATVSRRADFAFFRIMEEPPNRRTIGPLRCKLRMVRIENGPRPGPPPRGRDKGRHEQHHQAL